MDVQRIGGKGSALAKKHHLYIDIVTVADVPERYEERLLDLEAREFRGRRVGFSRSTTSRWRS